MESAVRVRTAVLPGGRIEVTDPELRPGDEVEVIILAPDAGAVRRRSVVDILAEAPGGLEFKSAEDVDAYLKEERDSWDR